MRISINIKRKPREVFIERASHALAIRKSERSGLYECRFINTFHYEVMDERDGLTVAAVEKFIRDNAPDEYIAGHMLRALPHFIKKVVK